MKGKELVKVVWVDSVGSQGAWSLLKDHIGEGKDRRLLCESIGYLAYEGLNNIVIIPHICFGSEEHCTEDQYIGEMTIPKVSVVSLDPIGRKVVPSTTVSVDWNNVFATALSRIQELINSERSTGRTSISVLDPIEAEVENAFTLVKIRDEAGISGASKVSSEICGND